MKLLLCILIFPFAIFSQLTYTTQITKNTSCDCQYTGPSILINEIDPSPRDKKDGTTLDGNIYSSNSSSNNGEWIELYNPNPCYSVDISNFIFGTYNKDDGLGASFVLPDNLIVKPLGFAIIRGRRAAPPPVGVVDVIVDDVNGQLCIEQGNSVSRFWLENSGGWLAMYNSKGIVQDAVIWGDIVSGVDIFGNPIVDSTNYKNPPCIPAFNNLPVGFSHLPTLEEIGNVPNVANVNFNVVTSKSKNPVRIPDGSSWSSTLQDDTLSYGICNDLINGCIQPILNCNGSLKVTMTSGTPPYTYLWNDQSHQTTAQANNLCPGEYCVDVTDALGVKQRICLIVSDDPLRISALIDSASCGNSNGAIEIIPSRNTGTSYVWDPTSATTNKIQNLASGDYNVKVSNGDCVIDTNFTIPPYILMNTTTKASPIDCSTNQGIAEVVTTGGELPLSYSWSHGATSAKATVTSSTLYTVIVTDIYGCTSTSTITTPPLKYPSIHASSNSPICKGDTVELAVMTDNPQAATFSWSGPNGYTSGIQNPIILNSTDDNVGSYIASVDSSGCVSTQSIELKVLTSDDIQFEADKISGCVPLEVKFISSALADTLIWLMTDDTITTTQKDLTHIFDTVGDYNIKLVSINNNCVDTSNQEMFIHVSANSESVFTLNQTEIDDSGTTFSFNNQSVNSTNYSWDFGDGTQSTMENPTHTYPEQHSYMIATLITNNIDNCPDTSKQLVQLKVPILFYIPNTFTPNGDGFNQKFQPIFKYGIIESSYKLRIFNRWGEEIFTSSTVEDGWDGTFNGKKSPDGVYIWTMEFKDQNTQKLHKERGHVNLLR